MLKRILKAILDGRQAKADRIIAERLHRTEYRKESFENVLEKVRAMRHV